MTSNQTSDQARRDSHFEKHLHEFRPLAPRALAIPRHRVPWNALAIAAVLLLAAGASFFPPHARQSTAPHPFAPPSVTIGTLNAALRDNDEILNRFLDDVSPNILPRGQHGTVLYELGKE